MTPKTKAQDIVVRYLHADARGTLTQCLEIEKELKLYKDEMLSELATMYAALKRYGNEIYTIEFANLIRDLSSDKFVTTSLPKFESSNVKDG